MYIHIDDNEDVCMVVHVTLLFKLTDLCLVRENVFRIFIRISINTKSEFKCFGIFQ